LRALESYVEQHSDQAAGHLLLGFHYGYLGLRFDALRELELALNIAPQDAMAAALADAFRQHSPSPAAQSAPRIDTAPRQTEEPAGRLEGPLLLRPADS
jgi:hypothetical protein